MASPIGRRCSSSATSRSCPTCARPSIPGSRYASISRSTTRISTRRQLLKNGEVLKVRPDPEGQSIQYSSDQRVVFIQSLSLTGLESGDYRIGVEVEDRLSGNHLQLAEDFTVRPFRAD